MSSETAKRTENEYAPAMQPIEEDPPGDRVTKLENRMARNEAMLDSITRDIRELTDWGRQFQNDVRQHLSQIEKNVAERAGAEGRIQLVPLAVVAGVGVTILGLAFSPLWTAQHEDERVLEQHVESSGHAGTRIQQAKIGGRVNLMDERIGHLREIVNLRTGGAPARSAQVDKPIRQRLDQLANQIESMENKSGGRPE